MKEEDEADREARKVAQKAIDKLVAAGRKKPKSRKSSKK